MNQLFDLSRVFDVPVYGEGLAIHQYPSVLDRDPRDTVGGGDLRSDFYPTYSSGWDWEPSSLASKWRVPELIGNVSPFMDYPCMELSIPAFSARAVECLRDLLEPNGELLPATCNGVTLYVFNCLKVVEILDHSQTIGSYSQRNFAPHNRKLRTFNSIGYYSIEPDKLDGLSIFMLRELKNGSVFVTNKFYERVIENGLNGFDFLKVWPLAKGTDYFSDHMNWLKKSRDNKGIITDYPEELTRQSLIVEIPILESPISGENKKRIDRFKHDVRQLLENIGHHDRYGGRLEKTQNLKEATVLKFSCPSSQILLKRIEPGLKSLNWPKPIQITLREVPLDVVATDGKEDTIKHVSDVPS